MKHIYALSLVFIAAFAGLFSCRKDEIFYDISNGKVSLYKTTAFVIVEKIYIFSDLSKFYPATTVQHEHVVRISNNFSFAGGLISERQNLKYSFILDGVQQFQTFVEGGDLTENEKKRLAEYFVSKVRTIYEEINSGADRTHMNVPVLDVSTQYDEIKSQRK